MSGRVRGGTPDVLAFLRRLPLLGGLGAADLERLAAGARRIRVRAGRVIIREGSAGDGLYLLLRGRLEVTKAGGGEELLLARQGPGSFVGEMALLGGSPRSATVRALRPSELLVIAPAAFHQLLVTSPDAALTILDAVGRRLAATESALVRQERLAGLGTLAAGLAHELNNPAAAAGAAALQLQRAVQLLEARGQQLPPAATRRARAFAMVEPAPPPAAAAADPDAEAELARWLAEQGACTPQAEAVALVACGWSRERLQDFTATLPAVDRAAFLDWLSARCEVSTLTRDLLAATRAISEVVAAVRAHVNLDRAALRPVDLRASIEAALRVARSRWQPRISVSLDIAADLEPVEANAGELNQVWANLIANAIEAMDGHGRLQIRARRRDQRAVISFADSGSGVPPAVRCRIFEPFFTTRADRGGTGLGLHIVRDIVVHRHGGRIDVRSRPGRTVFRVVLPLRRT